MTTFYNDNDTRACAWLRQLIKAGLLPKGKVDEHDIKDLSGLQRYRQVHLFAGIGGWPYALQLAGWPADRPVWTGSCPCQPFSAAGKRKGQADERHVWPMFLRLIRECQPATIFGEQVASDDGYRWLARVRDDLEEASYAVGCADMPACSQGSPIIRQRLWWVASANGRQSGNGHLQRSGQHGQQPQNGGPTIGLACAKESRSGKARTQHAQSRRRQCEPGRAGVQVAGWLERTNHERCKAGAGAGYITESFWSDYEVVPCLDGKARRTEPGVFPLATGIPGRVALLRGYGNSIVPQVAAVFVKAFLEAESELAW